MSRGGREGVGVTILQYYNALQGELGIFYSDKTKILQPPFPPPVKKSDRSQSMKRLQIP